MAASKNSSDNEPGCGGITIKKFNGKNYLPWSQSARMFITGKQKREYLTCIATKPAESDAASFTKWENDDNQLDLYDAQTWETTKDAKTIWMVMEKKRTIQLLLGLNKDLDAVKIRVMGTKPFPSPKEAFAEVLTKEDRRQPMVMEKGEAKE
ncbi:hypothetical protein LINGRAPRIM_LOCUS2418 [Linum grandiflorum]